MINQELEQKLRALEEFVANCFYVPYNETETTVEFQFNAYEEVSDLIDPAYKDYLIELVKKD